MSHDNSSPSFFQHHFHDVEQQYETSKFGMWAFILTEVLTFAGLFVAYIVWLEFFLQLRNNTPCGSISCGFPYLFLNDLDYVGRLIFYGIVLVLGILSFFFCRKLIKGPGHSLF